jgi:hypothetical protein
VVYLSAGQHSVVFYMREDGAMMDTVELELSSSVTATPTATSTPTPTATPTPTSGPTQTPSATPTGHPALIFADGFESGDLSAWTASAAYGGDLSVTAGAALVGDYGLQALVDDNNAIYVQDDAPGGVPDALGYYLARFYFDPNSIPMAGGDAHVLFSGYSGATSVLRVELRRNSGVYQVRSGAVDASSFWHNANWATTGDEAHSIDVEWWAKVTGEGDGGFTVWIDGEELGGTWMIDNETDRMDSVRLGAVSAMLASTSTAGRGGRPSGRWDGPGPVETEIIEQRPSEPRS